MVCPRCRNPAPRLINGQHCVGCYNRHAEALKGRNRKGTKPRLCERLHTVSLTVQTGSRQRIVERLLVTDMIEAMIAIAKASTGPVSFGLPRLCFAPQLELAV